jgi:eukaryotic-like serine/threonine-protein kinase
MLPANDPTRISELASDLAQGTESATDPADIAGSGRLFVADRLLPADTSRYALGLEIARGGMGMVYRAIDHVLQREVAVKVLKDTIAPDSGTSRRFFDEARISAQLQHPGIPPVHDLGIFPDGRPFLAMKLIKGETLDKLLKNRSDPVTDRGRFVAAFEQICQALAFAHSHQVIHRDLKPANVMVGGFGEVQVMDWGLAKVLPDSGPVGGTGDSDATAAATDIRSLRDSDGSFTQAGSVLGTPAYMPPEQAVGAVAKVDKRSDVFGLGATLAVILSGKPPFESGSAETTRVRAAQGDVADCFARLDECGADPDLVELCKRCLAPKREDRPADAGDVARAVAALRQAADERAREAELERVAIELRSAEQRKRRRIQLALAIAVGLLLFGVGGAAWWQDGQAADRRAETAGRERDERDRLGRNADAVVALLDRCEQSLRADDAPGAAISLEAAVKRAAEGGADDSAGRLDQCRADLAALRDLDAADQFRWTPVGNKFPTGPEMGKRYRAALGRFGADPAAIPADESARRVCGSAIRGRLVAALDWLLWYEQAEGTLAVLRAADPDQYRNSVRDAALARDRAKLADLAGRPEAADQPAEFVALLGDARWRPPSQCRVLLESALHRQPGNLMLLMAAGHTYPVNQREGADERVRWFQAAAGVAVANPAAHNLLGIALSDRGDVDGAIAEYKEAIRLQPGYGPAHHNLGSALSKNGDRAGAVAAYKEAVRYDPTYAPAHYGLALARENQWELVEAETEYREAIRIDPAYVPARVNLGIILRDRGDLVGAEAEHREAVRIEPRHLLARFNLGLTLRRKGDLDGAIVEYEEAIRIDRRYTDAHNNLGFARQLKGDLDGAIAAYKDALRLNPKHSFARDNLAQVERWKELLPRLPAVAAGRAVPQNPAEACEFASLCSLPFQGKYVLAVRLYDGAFGADPMLATDHGQNAAFAAARAGCGEGVDPPEDPAGRGGLRARALAWLRADLARQQKQARSSNSSDRKAAAAVLWWWLAAPELSALRPGFSRIGTKAGEQAEWDTFWAEVRVALADARKPAVPRKTEPAPRTGE